MAHRQCTKAVQLTVQAERCSKRVAWTVSLSKISSGPKVTFTVKIRKIAHNPVGTPSHFARICRSTVHARRPASSSCFCDPLVGSAGGHGSSADGPFERSDWWWPHRRAHRTRPSACASGGGPRASGGSFSIAVDHPLFQALGQPARRSGAVARGPAESGIGGLSQVANSGTIRGPLRTQSKAM